MAEAPLILVLSEDRVSYSYYKVFPEMEKDALEVAVQWDAAAESGLSNTDAAAAYQKQKDGRICIAVLAGEALASYKQMFVEAGVSLRDIIFAEQTEELLESEGGLRYRSVFCSLATPLPAWTEEMRLAFTGAMQWLTGTAISFLSKRQNPKVFRWKRMAAILLIISVGVFLMPLWVTSMQLQEVRADLTETDNRLQLLAEEIEQRAVHEQVEEKIRKKNHQLVVLSNYRAPYRGLLIRLGAIEAKGVKLEEVHFDAEGVSSMQGHAVSYEVLSEYMGALSSEDVSPLVHASLQQAEQRKDAQGIDFIITLHLPQEVLSDEK
ncbi:hypothetical protein [Selenomonas sp. TAMA-11512]|uniref:PilN domain-containing protein n=1 Tax=Selenomonas sp. TAMA-11512 TaxID=3095337 RepID=UPI0030D10BE7